MSAHDGAELCERGGRRRGSLGALRKLLRQRHEILGCIEIERQRFERLGRDIEARAAGAVAMALGAVLAEGRTDRVGRGEQQGVGAGRVAVGDDRDAARGHPLERPVELSRIEQRAVTGEQGRALSAQRKSADDAERGGLGMTVVLRLLQDLDRRLHPLGAAEGDALGARLAGDEDHPLDRAGRGDRDQHVAEHRLDNGGALFSVERFEQALLGLAEALHGNDRGRLHRGMIAPSAVYSVAANSSVLAASARRLAPSTISVEHGRVGMWSGGGSGSAESTIIAAITSP